MYTENHVLVTDILERCLSSSRLGVAAIIATIPFQNALANDQRFFSRIYEIDYEIQSDGADRILLAGKLRTLTQQVAASSCAVTSGIDVDEAHDVLEQATADFDRYIAALREGDADLNIRGPKKTR